MAGTVFLTYLMCDVGYISLLIQSKSLKCLAALMTGRKNLGDRMICRILPCTNIGQLSGLDCSLVSCDSSSQDQPNIHTENLENSANYIFKIQTLISIKSAHMQRDRRGT